MMSFDAGKVFDTKLKWRLFSITLSIALAFLTLAVLLWAMLAMINLIARVAPMLEALKASQIYAFCVYAFFGGLFVFWLTFHYFYGYLYVGFLSKIGGSKRRLFAQTLSIVTGCVWLSMIFLHASVYQIWTGGHALLDGGFAIAADLLFMLGMFLSLRKIKSQSTELEK